MGTETQGGMSPDLARDELALIFEGLTDLQPSKLAEVKGDFSNMYASLFNLDKMIHDGDLSEDELEPAVAAIKERFKWLSSARSH